MYRILYAFSSIQFWWIMKLTDLVIKRAKAKEKAYTLADGNGLSLLIDPRLCPLII
ncbi:hypothetical protein XSR1_350002 [Xenorhabdus szentirmaii DSM 16338]|uniref:Uncharacterized protein n=1 Tax=Xenorhabdus szentirmaii DSM 16338 TaxID=1427518 RepID=W1J0Q0_9GAMM|nr:hypothetical protein XSR1_350002 [Xenorhabdus szentirmaii DSM 16338]